MISKSKMKEIGVTKDDVKIMEREGVYFIKKIGQGTFASVALVEYYVSSSIKPMKLACKVFDKEKADRDFLQDFFHRELDILTKLENPHIIPLHSILKHGFKLYIFMQYAEKGDLMEHLRINGPVSENQARLWFTQISLGLQYLHDKDIAHRDIKCENILLTRCLNAKLTDFGFARYIADNQVTETFCGSQPYTSPELIAGLPYRPKCADVWAIGVVLYMMLNAAFPFNSESLTKQMFIQLKEEWEFLPHILNWASSDSRAMVKYMLNPDANKRPTIHQVLCQEWIHDI